jgi:hypothetical protein
MDLRLQAFAKSLPAYAALLQRVLETMLRHSAADHHHAHE